MEHKDLRSVYIVDNGSQAVTNLDFELNDVNVLQFQPRQSN